MVELLFLPSVYSPCPVCSGTRYNEKTLEIKYRNKSIADVLGMTVKQEVKRGTALTWEILNAKGEQH